MVAINFRLPYGYNKKEVLALLKKLGYDSRGTNSNSIKIADKPLLAEELIREQNSGRYHLFAAFGRKASGTEHYRQMKTLLHYDLIKTHNGKERHYPDLNEKRNWRELYRIEKAFKRHKLGRIELKDRYCAHRTVRLDLKARILENLRANGYYCYEIEKYRKRMNGSQCVFCFLDQEPYMHIVCVYATIRNKKHILSKKKSKRELKRIFAQVY